MSKETKLEIEEALSHAVALTDERLELVRNARNGYIHRGTTTATEVIEVDDNIDPRIAHLKSTSETLNLLLDAVLEDDRFANVVRSIMES